jgi:tetratricopeptide (TPR) repeat protein
MERRADLAAARGDLAKAEQHEREAVALAEKLFPADHLARLAEVNRLVGVLWAAGKFSEAEQLVRDELAEIEKQAANNKRSLTLVIETLAGLLQNSARTDEAVDLYRRALAINEQAFGKDSREAARDHLAIGASFGTSGRYDEARFELNDARTISESKNDLPLQIAALDELSVLAANRGAPAEAVIHSEKALELGQKVWDPESPALVPVLAQLGRFYLMNGRAKDASEIIERIKRLVGEDPPEQSPGYLTFLQLQAMHDAGNGDFGAAESLFLRAIVVATKYQGPMAEAVAIDQYNLAYMYLKAHRYSEAVSSFAKALASFKRQHGASAPFVGYALIGAAAGYAGLGDNAKFKALLRAAGDILGPILQSHPAPKWL